MKVFKDGYYELDWEKVKGLSLEGKVGILQEYFRDSATNQYNNKDALDIFKIISQHHTDAVKYVDGYKERVNNGEEVQVFIQRIDTEQGCIYIKQSHSDKWHYLEQVEPREMKYMEYPVITKSGRLTSNKYHLGESRHFSECDTCGKDINIGDTYYNLGGEHIHIECINEYLDVAEDV